MNLKAALLATGTACAFLLVAACGGGSAESQSGASSASSQLQPGGGNGAGTAGSSNTVCVSGAASSSGTGTSVQYAAIDLNSSANAEAVGLGIGDGEQVGYEGYGANTRAMLWRGSASSVVDLGTWRDRARALATSGGIQVGWGEHDDNTVHALKWAGSANSVVDLHPDGLVRYSWALGISGDQIVGWGEIPGLHALLWTAQGVVDLNPSAISHCIARATDGKQQVGRCGHAVLWTGSAGSAVDLHPASGYSGSDAFGVNGGQQVGVGFVGTLRHALLWTGSAQSVVDLHRSGFCETLAVGVSAGRQVGWGTTADGSTRALLWNGTADSLVDLHVFLRAGFIASTAEGIDASGNIIGSAVDARYFRRAILWVRQ